jgi:hypothetical protein
LDPIILNKEDTIKDIYAKATMYHLINFRIYSDLLALLNETPNGLVTFEGDAKFFINMVPCGRFYFLNYLQPFLNIARFDSQSKYVEINDSIYDRKTNLDFIQKSNVYSGVTANMVSYITRDLNTNFDINVGGGFFFAPYKIESIKQEDNLQAVNYFVNIKVITRRVNNFIFDFGISFVFTSPFENENLTYDYYPHEKRSFYYNRMITGEIRYKVDYKNQLFLRARYVSYRENDKYRNNAFNQVQIGYKAQIPIKNIKK